MTEQEWLSSDSPAEMLAHIDPPGLCGVSLRKLRLFTAVSLRYLLGRHEPPMTDAQWQGVEALERFADDEEEDGMFEALEEANLPRPGIALATVAGTRMHAKMMTQYQMRDMKQFQCATLRDIFGNPWRNKPSLCGRESSYYDPSGKDWYACSACRDVLRYSGGLVVQVAQDIYDRLAWDEMPILGDALEESGATDANLLGHLRGTGPHARGCWATDLILGKE